VASLVVYVGTIFSCKKLHTYSAIGRLYLDAAVRFLFLHNPIQVEKELAEAKTKHFEREKVGVLKIGQCSDSQNGVPTSQTQ